MTFSVPHSFVHYKSITYLKIIRQRYSENYLWQEFIWHWWYLDDSLKSNSKLLQKLSLNFIDRLKFKTHWLICWVLNMYCKVLYRRWAVSYVYYWLASINHNVFVWFLVLLLNFCFILLLSICLVLLLRLTFVFGIAIRPAIVSTLYLALADSSSGKVRIL
jgi:hypothetical protein